MERKELCRAWHCPFHSENAHLNMEFDNLQSIENATRLGRREMFRIGSALLFIVGIMLYASGIHPAGGSVSIELVVAAVIGGYMAMNIGANDVANNVGPAVGSKALTLTGAIIIAAIFEASGAFIAGGNVVNTIKKGIIDPAKVIRCALQNAVSAAGMMITTECLVTDAPEKDEKDD